MTIRLWPPSRAWRRIASAGGRSDRVAVRTSTPYWSATPDDLLQERLPAASGLAEEAAAQAAARDLAGDREQGDLGVGRLRQGERHLGPAPRDLRAGDRGQDAEAAVERLLLVRAPCRGERQRALERAGDAGDLLREAARRPDRGPDAEDQQVVALARLLGDRVVGRRFRLPGQDVDGIGRGLVVLAWRGGLDGLRGRPHDALHLGRLVGARRLGQVEDRHRHAAQAGEQAGETGGEAALGAVVGGQQQALQVGDEAPGLERLALEPLALLLPERQPAAAPSAASAAWPSW